MFGPGQEGGLTNNISGTVVLVVLMVMMHDHVLKLNVTSKCYDMK